MGNFNGYSHNHRDSRKNRRNQNRQSSNSYERDSVVSPKLDTPVCKYCGQPITDITAALADKESGEPVHFDCVLAKLNEQEKLNPNEKITYIGQGRFAAVYFENPHDLRHFTINRIIEWEPREKKYDWRTNIAGLYSQVK